MRSLSFSRGGKVHVSPRLSDLPDPRQRALGHSFPPRARPPPATARPRRRRSAPRSARPSLMPPPAPRRPRQHRAATDPAGPRHRGRRASASPPPPRPRGPPRPAASRSSGPSRIASTIATRPSRITSRRSVSAISASRSPMAARPSTSVSSSTSSASPAISTCSRRSERRALEHDHLLRQPVQPRPGAKRQPAWTPRRHAVPGPVGPLGRLAGADRRSPRLDLQRVVEPVAPGEPAGGVEEHHFRRAPMHARQHRLGRSLLPQPLEPPARADHGPGAAIHALHSAPGVPSRRTSRSSLGGPQAGWQAPGRLSRFRSRAYAQGVGRRLVRPRRPARRRAPGAGRHATRSVLSLPHWNWPLQGPPEPCTGWPHDRHIDTPPPRRLAPAPA